MTFRAQLIASGAIRPRVDGALTPTISQATLRLDDAGRGAARQHMDHYLAAGRELERPELQAKIADTRARQARGNYER